VRILITVVGLDVKASTNSFRYDNVLPAQGCSMPQGVIIAGYRAMVE
jgi:hypothetical protein